MTERYGNARALANAGAATSCRQPGNKLPLISAVMQAARDLWPTKTDRALAVCTEASERMCRYWLKESFALSADALDGLICSDDGLEILNAMMKRRKANGRAVPVWWRDFKRSCELGAIRREIEERRKTLERLEMDQ